MKTIALDARPRNLQASNGSPFEIPLSEWKSINDCLVNVAATDPQTTASIVNVIPQYADLKRIAGQWKPTTLPNVIRLAQGVYDYGSNTIAGQLTKLQELLSTMQSEIPAGSQASFQSLMSQILATTQQNTAIASEVTEDLAGMDTAVQVINKQLGDYMADSLAMPDASDEDADMAAIATVAQRMSGLASMLSLLGTLPQTDIERIRGAWSAISDDLSSFQSSVNEELSTSDPFLAELNLDVAIPEWHDLAIEAHQFAEGASSF